MGTKIKIEKSPNYQDYFEQYCMEEKSWLAELFSGVDMSWITDIQKEMDKDRAYYAAFNGGISGPEKYSHDPLSDDFPCFHNWPLSIQREFDVIVKRQGEQRREIANTGRKIECGSVTLYMDCQDGAHYLSTRYFDHGNLYRATLSDENEVEFDSIDTAIYAFSNDWADWNREYGKAKRKQDELMMLEALRLDSRHGGDDDSAVSDNGCQHEDLGSLGYKHGDIVDCPFCGERAEVW